MHETLIVLLDTLSLPKRTEVYSGLERISLVRLAIGYLHPDAKDKIKIPNVIFFIYLLIIEFMRIPFRCNKIFPK